MIRIIDLIGYNYLLDILNYIDNSFSNDKYVIHSNKFYCLYHIYYIYSNKSKKRMIYLHSLTSQSKNFFDYYKGLEVELFLLMITFDDLKIDYIYVCMEEDYFNKYNKNIIFKNIFLKYGIILNKEIKYGKNICI